MLPDQITPNLLLLGTRNHEELYVDSTRRIPVTGPARWAFKDAERADAIQFTLKFFKEHKELVDAGFHVAQNILFTSLASKEVQQLYLYFGACKFQREIIADAHEEARTILEQASVEASRIAQDGTKRALAGIELEEKAKARIEAAENEMQTARAKLARDIERCEAKIDRNILLSLIRIEKVKRAAEPWKVTRTVLLDTFIRSDEHAKYVTKEGEPALDRDNFEFVETGVRELIPASSAILRQVPYFAKVFANQGEAGESLVKTNEDAFFSATDGKKLAYFINLDIPAQLVRKYLDYLENPALLFDPFLYDTDTLSDLYRFGAAICDKKLIDELEEFAGAGFSNEDLLQRLKLCGLHKDFATRYDGSFASLLDLEFSYINKDVMSLMLDYKVISFASELSLWNYFIEWVEYQAQSSFKSVEGFLLENPGMLEKIHFERMSKRDNVTVLSDERLGTSIRFISQHLLRDTSRSRSRVYVNKLKSTAQFRVIFAFVDFRRDEFLSEEFQIGNRTFCLWSEVKNESAFFGFKNCDKESVSLKLKTKYLHARNTLKEVVAANEGLGVNIPLRDLVNIKNLDVEFIITVVEEDGNDVE